MKFYPVKSLILQTPAPIKMSEHFLTLSSICTCFEKKKSFTKTLRKRWNCSKMINFTFFLNVFYAICILKSLIATFQLSSAASLNLGRSQNGLFGNGLNKQCGSKMKVHILILISTQYLHKQLTFPKWQILDSSKLIEIAVENFKFDWNGRKFSKQVKNTVEKGEIARFDQFLLFPQCFQNTCTADT